MRIDLPGSCSSDAYRSGDADAGLAVYHSSGDSTESCLTISHEVGFMTTDEMLRLATEEQAADPSARTTQNVSTPCGTSVRYESRGSTVYVFEHTGAGVGRFLWHGSRRHE
jgi:hypothetical protein